MFYSDIIRYHIFVNLAITVCVAFAGALTISFLPKGKVESGKDQ
jgi:hypothetical protein